MSRADDEARMDRYHEPPDREAPDDAIDREELAEWLRARAHRARVKAARQKRERAQRRGRGSA